MSALDLTRLRAGSSQKLFLGTSAAQSGHSQWHRRRKGGP